MPTYHKDTGNIITGLDEVFQGIETILATPKRSRVMRRDFGADTPRMVDRGMSPLTLIDWFAAIADAIRAEPRFKFVRSALSPDSEVSNGQALFDLFGTYFPRGHLGDFSEAVTVSGRTVKVSDRAI